MRRPVSTVPDPNSPLIFKYWGLGCYFVWQKDTFLKKKKKAKVKKPYNKIHWAKVTQQRTGRCFAEWDVLINRGVLQVRYL